MEFEISAELVGIYLEDAREHLAVVDAALLRLEREGSDPEIAASLLGPLHTLKGNSGMMGFTAIKDYVHRLEEVLGRARDGALRLDAAALDRLLQGAAALRDAIEAACSAGREQRDLAPEKAALGELLESSRPAPALVKRLPRRHRRLPPSRSRGCGRRSRSLPAPVTAAVSTVPATPAAPAATAAAAAATAAAARARSSMVRVDFAKLDHLLNLVGELIVHRTKLTELGRQIAAIAPGPGPGAARGGAPGRERLDAAAGDDHGRADAADPPRLRALPAPGARPRPPAGQAGRAGAAGRGHARRQGRDRRDRRAARAPDPQRGRPRHRAARPCASPEASRRPERSCCRPRRSRTRS